MGCTASKAKRDGRDMLALSGTTKLSSSGSSGSSPTYNKSPSAVYTAEELELIRQHKLKLFAASSENLLSPDNRDRDGARWLGGSMSMSRRRLDEPMPAVVGRCKIGKLLGKGAWAEVYEGENSAAGKMYAVKSFNKRRVGRRDLEATAKKEVALMRALKEHPNIVSLVDVHDDPDWYHLVIDYVPDGTLQQKIDSAADGKLPVEQAMEWFQDLLIGVEYMHSLNICHRDIKPANLLLDGERLLITDFGLGEWVPAEGLFEYCGTPDYIAPEIIEISRMEYLPFGYAGGPADMWSCGVTLYTMLTGRTPWGQSTQEYRNKEILAAAVKLHKLAKFPESVQALVGSILVRDPRARPTAAEILFGKSMQFVTGVDAEMIEL
eukprot:TRINITY_DN737_c0_g1_i2.p1 TRINITY_DN737_c0_g1~~TRINITY_DN737_c0_g1_i2.p1  ORF type:complete len:398 (+),score=138.92 TRINITY_DN737_c0_g1_i2:59-1195(+)